MNLDNILDKKFVLNGIVLISFIMLSILSFWMILKSHVIVNMADTQFHFKRIIELSEDIRYHNFLPLYSFNQFHGSAVMLLYPYLNLYPIALLSFIIKSKVTLFYVCLIGILFLGLNISYYSCLKYSRNIHISYMFSIIYMLSSVFMGYCLSLTDFGAITSFVFWPLIIFGCLSFLHDSSKYLELSTGLILIGFSHIPSLIISILLVIMWYLLNIKKLIYKKKAIINICKIFIITLLFTSIIWLPMINFIIKNRFIIHFTNPVIPSGVSPGTFIRSGLGNFDSLGLGFFASITVIISLLFFKKFNKYEKQMYLISMIVILFSSSFIKIFPLEILRLLKSFQFLYRFLIIPVVLLSYIFSLIIVKYLFKYRHLYLLVILLSVLIQLGGETFFIHKYSNIPSQINYNYLFSKMDNYKVNKLINKYPDGTNQKGVVNKHSTGSDYYPKTVFKRLNDINSNYASYLYNNKVHYISLHRIGYNKFIINKNISTNRNISLPFLHYKGEKLRIRVNNKISPYHINNNTIIINNLYGRNNVIQIISYHNHLIMNCEAIMILLGLLFILIHICVSKRRRALRC